MGLKRAHLQESHKISDNSHGFCIAMRAAWGIDALDRRFFTIHFREWHDGPKRRIIDEASIAYLNEIIVLSLSLLESNPFDVIGQQRFDEAKTKG